MFKPGTKIRTLYQFSATGVIAKPRKGESTEGLPDRANWFIVQFDDFDPSCTGRLCIHRNMLAVRNEP